jgi:hypothetical protein
MKQWSLPLVLLSVLVPTQLFARHLVIGLGLPPEHALWPKMQGYMSLVAEKADKELQIELRSTPFLRIPEEVNKGEMDGDLGRLPEVYGKGSTAVQVNEPASMLRLFFIFHKDHVMTDLESIRRQVTVAARENLFHRRACKELKLNCEFVGPGSSSMDMLRLKRVGSVLSTQFQIAEHMRLAADRSLFRVSENSWYMEPIYLYLARKNKDLAPKLASALKDLKQDGTYKIFFGMDP